MRSTHGFSETEYFNTRNHSLRVSSPLSSYKKKKKYTKSRRSESSSSSGCHHRRLKRKELHRRKHKKEILNKRRASSDSTVSHRRERKKRKSKSKHGENNKKEEKKGWGAYGVIQECDMWRKRPEFHLWLLEVKNENLEFLPAWKEKDLFREYMEDYNTATLPHEKYYVLEEWSKKNLASEHVTTSKLLFNDEELRRKELRELRERLKRHEFESAYQTIKTDTDKISAMRHQKVLHTQMQTLFRMGHISEAEKIRNRITGADD